MRLPRLLAGLFLTSVVVGLPMCGSDDAKKHLTAEGGEAGADQVPGAGGSASPTPEGGAGGEMAAPLGGTGGDVAVPLGGAGGEVAVPLGGAGGDGGQVSSGGQSGGGQGAEGGAAPFCAVDTTSCCSSDEPSCSGDWPAVCGQDFSAHSCCDDGQREVCSVPYFEGNYHVMFGRADCACTAGSCDCTCQKGDACPYQEPDCYLTSWHDACVQGNSPTCCNSATGTRETCVYNNGKTFTSSPVIDDCTGEGFGTDSCSNCIDVEEPPCDSEFFNGCSSDISYCSNATVGYRMSCQDGAQQVLCTCDPSVIDF